MTKRRFIDAPQSQRCIANIIMVDGSLAQCGRYRKVGEYCRQHEKMKMTDRSITLRSEGDEPATYDLDIAYVSGFGWIVWDNGEQWNDGEPFRSRIEAADAVARTLNLPRLKLREAWRG